MLQDQTGDLLQAPVEALVNTVNLDGVMGKGIALQFKRHYPENFKVYQRACKQGELQIGQMLVEPTGLLSGPKYIINFPTKTTWRRPSEYAYIAAGLLALRKELEALKIASVAIPPLGCGNGGLDWAKVKPMIQDALADYTGQVLLYAPSKDQVLTTETTKQVKLTPARALLLKAEAYRVSVDEEPSEFSAVKLMYFYQQMGQRLDLQFKSHLYGPYTTQVNHVLNYLAGKYLIKGSDNKPFTPIGLNMALMPEVDSYFQQELTLVEQQRYHDLVNFIDGFESDFSLELLSSIDWLIRANSTWDKDLLFKQLQDWSPRKGKIFSRYQFDIVYQHLTTWAPQLRYDIAPPSQA